MNIQDPAVRTKVRNALGEMSASMTRVEAERDLMKEIAKKLEEEHQVSKRSFNKLAKAYHKQSFAEEASAFDEFTTLYETILGNE